MVARLLLPLLFVLAGCAGAPVPEPSQAIPADGSGSLVEAVQGRAAAHPNLSGFRLLVDSEEAFAVRLALLQGARRSLDIQYYIVRDGLTTRLLLAQLLRAADRGVRVRLLLDDTSSDRRENQIAALDAHPLIEVRLFNPLHLGRLPGAARNLGRLLNLSQQHRRMHNKLWLADSSVAIVGGRNLGDEYFDAGPARDFSDLDLLGAGPVAEQLGQSFDQYWNHRLSKPLAGLRWRPPTAADLGRLRQRLEAFLISGAVRNSPFAGLQSDSRLEARLEQWLSGLTWASGQALWDAPAKVLSRGEPDPHLLLSTQLAPLFRAISEELILVSAYFVPGDRGLDYLTQRADAGVSIRVLTNSLEATDVPAVHGGYAPYRRALLAHGIRLFE
ncbi:phospholipase D family protein, partial [Pseudomonas sp. CrR25]|nr:phospholipase D family protein [Pseudomonas sp. CrR25]